MPAKVTLERLLEICVRNTDLSQRQKNQQKDVLRQCWAAYDSWLLENLRAYKGAECINFGNFTWEVLGALDNQAMRPVFILSEAFCRSHKLIYAKADPSRAFKPAENINYTKLAIRYTENLSKDQVFSSLRTIFRAMGQLVYRGEQLHLDFTFGTLKSKKRRVKFLFLQAPLVGNPHESELDAKIAEALDQRPEINSELGIEAGGRADLGEPLASEGASESKEHPDGAAAAKEEAVFTSTADIKPALAASELGEATAAGAAEELAEEPAEAAEPMEPIEPLETGALDELPPVKGAGANTTMSATDKKLYMWVIKNPGIRDENELAKKDAVIESAFQRYVDSMEKEAQDAEYQQAVELDLAEKAEEMARLKQEKKERDATELQRDLLSQIAYTEEARKLEEKEIRNSQLRSILPEVRTTRRVIADDEEREFDELMRNKIFVVEGDYGRVVVPKKGLAYSVSRSALLKSLQDQISEKSMQKRFEREKSLTEGREWLGQMKEEMDEFLREEYDDALHKQQSLLLAWERDAHVKNLKKLRQQGSQAMKEYATQHLRTGTASNLGSTAASEAPKDVSVGFDSRTLSA
mmetsp:Transcript_16585/g.50915  ORF Transcript_16585/g.50915 Transcript_16585/m.50915 type:complete len:582 (+) Transcript_16585:268-2013(+)